MIDIDKVSTEKCPACQGKGYINVPAMSHALPEAALRVAQQYPDPRFLEYVLASIVAVQSGVSLVTGHKHAKQILADKRGEVT